MTVVREECLEAWMKRAVVVHSSADKEFAELIFRAYEQKQARKFYRCTTAVLFFSASRCDF